MMERSKGDGHLHCPIKELPIRVLCIRSRTNGKVKSVELISCAILQGKGKDREGEVKIERSL
jgi:hypothetical protein